MTEIMTKLLVGTLVVVTAVVGAATPAHSGNPGEVELIPPIVVVRGPVYTG